MTPRAVLCIYSTAKLVRFEYFPILCVRVYQCEREREREREEAIERAPVYERVTNPHIDSVLYVAYSAQKFMR